MDRYDLPAGGSITFPVPTDSEMLSYIASSSIQMFYSVPGGPEGRMYTGTSYAPCFALRLPPGSNIRIKNTQSTDNVVSIRWRVVE